MIMIDCVHDEHEMGARRRTCETRRAHIGMSLAVTHTILFYYIIY